ncbi:SIR2 family protein [Arthrobacter oryzae]|uniref:SIR2 family protein n=1 Tax=Arthrobacter oryzae TaxID=409290 RepID=UPI002856B30F|nr:SIR2 family protein [Arthrobacter oryzae]MDR6506753.1 hypothetical protein [Arthrobacter oryzae]
MHFSGVDIPLDLLEAHEEGRLVLFVGAGASMARPTNLPSFTGLAAELAAEFGASLRDDAEPEDIVLGRLDDREHTDVHASVHRHISKAKQGNSLHTALARLAKASKAVRIVTTNYDPFLSLALARDDVSFEEFHAPALPMGDDFEGIVYLHGSLKQHPRQLVVTDKDFGRAYLSDAWAARFLERMFSEYVVCFIGYSHKDVVLSYLARGLRPRSKRYAFTSEGDAASSRWSSLGISPIHYEGANEHRQMSACIEKWGNWAGSGLIDRHQLVSDLAGSSPSGIPDEDDFLERAIRDTVLMRAFCDRARGLEWLQWVANREVFTSIVQNSAEPLLVSQHLIADWFAENYGVSDDHSLTALAILRRSARRPNVVLWRAICRALQRVDEPRNWITLWTLWLLDNFDATAPGATEDLAGLLAEANALTETDVLMILEALLMPRPRASAGVLGDRIEYVVEVGDFWLEQIANKHFGTPLEESTAVAALPILEASLERVFLRNRVASGPHFDAWSFRREAVESVGPNFREETSDFVIDLARDCLDALIAAEHVELDLILRKWTNSDVPLLRRLAVYGWTRRTDISDTARLAWVLDKKLLFEADIHHELFALVASVLPTAGSDTYTRLLDEVLHGPDSKEQPSHDYEVFRHLVWITRLDPASIRAADALTALKKKHPDFSEPEHPDMTGYQTDVRWSTAEDEAPWGEQELHDLVRKDPKAAAQEIRMHQSKKESLDPYSWWGASTRIATVVSRWPEDGFLLLDHFRHDSRTLKAVIEGWAGVHKQEPLAGKILQTLVDLDLSEHGVAVAVLLAPRATNQTPGPPWHEFPDARDLALRTWEHLPRIPKTSSSDPVFEAINSPEGKLAEFWIEAIRHDWRKLKDDWDGVGGREREALDAILDPDSLRQLMAWPVLLYRLRFLYSADPMWTKFAILPLLDWNSSPFFAAGAWSVLLQSGGVNQALLEGGLKEGLVATARRVSDLTEGGQRQFSSIVASVMVHSLWSGQTKLQWLLDLTSSSSADSCAAFVSAIHIELGKGTRDLVDRSWNDWMKPYMKARMEGRPRGASPKEATALAEWVDVLSKTESIQKAVEVICTMPAGFKALLPRLRKMTDDRIRLAPRAFAQLLAHLLGNSSSPQHIGQELERVYMTLVHLDRVEVDDLLKIREEALRLGVHNAPAWPVPDR